MKLFKTLLEEAHKEDDVLRMWSSNYEVDLILKLSKLTIEELKEILGHKKGWDDAWLTKYKKVNK